MSMSTLYISGSKEPISIAYSEFPQGSKNACLPLLAASLLFDNALITNVPDINDVRIVLSAFAQMNLNFTFKDNSFTKFSSRPATLDLGEVFRETRAGFYILAALIFRIGNCTIDGFRVAGCRIGERGYDKIFAVFRAFGINLEQVGETLCLKVIRSYRGTEIALGDKGICTTAVALILAAQFKTETTLVGPGKAPELHDLVGYLRQNGVHIEYQDQVWRVAGAAQTLQHSKFRTQDDRIVIGTYAILALVSGGSFHSRPQNWRFLGALLDYLVATGCRSDSDSEDGLALSAPRGMQSMDMVFSDYPGLPTDLNPILTVLLCQTQGSKQIIDQVFPNRMSHVPQLAAMGQAIARTPQGCIITRPRPFQAGTLTGQDLRCAAALLVAACVAQGTSAITDWEYLNRGFEHLVSLAQKHRIVSIDGLDRECRAKRGRVLCEEII